jgi:uncharacterized membrane protein
MSAPETTPAPLPARALPSRAYARMTLVLRGGLLLALAILLGALVAYALAHPGASSESVIASNPILGYLGFASLASGLAAGSIESYLTLGLLVLIATPVVRVLSGFYYFARGGERQMATITFIVLVLLIVGITVLGPLIR